MVLICWQSLVATYATLSMSKASYSIKKPTRTKGAPLHGIQNHGKICPSLIGLLQMAVAANPLCQCWNAPAETTPRNQVAVLPKSDHNSKNIHNSYILRSLSQHLNSSVYHPSTNRCMAFNLDLNSYFVPIKYSYDHYKFLTISCTCTIIYCQKQIQHVTW